MVTIIPKFINNMLCDNVVSLVHITVHNSTNNLWWEGEGSNIFNPSTCGIGMRFFGTFHTLSIAWS